MAKQRETVRDIWEVAQREHGGTHFTLADTGELSDVLLVQDAPEPYVIKIVRPNTWNDSPMGAKALMCFERDLLRQLDQAKKEPPMEIPRIQGSGEIDGSHFFIMSLLSGRTVGYEPINQAMPETQRKHGRSLGLFIGWLATALTIEEYAQKYGSYRPVNATLPVIGHIQRTQQMGEMLHNKGYEELAHVTQDLQKQASKSDMAKTTTVIGHNDLHKDNLVSNETELTLQGVVDFMLTGPSNVEREMRYFAYYENEVRQAILDGCKEAGLPVDEDVANYWMASQVVCSAIRKIEKGQAVRPGVVAALEKWYPDHDWSELR